jgi:hypothetical protein
MHPYWEMSLDTNAAPTLAKASSRAAEAFGLNSLELAQVLGVSHEVFDHLLAGSQSLEPDSEEWARALGLLRIFDQLAALVGGDAGKMRAWINSFNQAFSTTPREILLRPTGIEVVLSYLLQFE